MTVEEELQGGIKNALEKGVPLEKAIQTFLNAGYPSQAVQSAARSVTEGATTIVSSPSPPTPEPDQVHFPDKLQSQEKQTQKSEEGVSKTKIFLLVAVLFILLLLLGASLLFREELIALIS